MSKGNALVGQSGGPTTVINASLAGVINAAVDCSEINKIYGMEHGIDGVLSEKFIDLTEEFDNAEKIRLLRNTPSSYLGSCRKKLSDSFDKEYEDIFRVFKEYNIKYFFYIGGNDSMDTVEKLSLYAKEINFPISIIGIPKTIDNDLTVTDHTPGFGSAAKYIATAIRETVCDATVYDKNSMTIIEIMGRNAGWLTAATALARTGSQCAPHLIYLPESVFDTSKFIEDLRLVNKTYKNVIVAVSEGIKTADGKYVCEGTGVEIVDVFGHKQLSGAAENLAALVNKTLGWKVRSMELSLLQRCSAHIASKVDNDEAFTIGKSAVSAAIEGKTGCMLYFNRISNNPYKVEIKESKIGDIANEVKTVPKSWINARGNDVTKECIDYIRPLIQGEVNITYEDGLPIYLQK